MKTAIFDKLGMHDAFFCVPPERRERVARICTPAGGAQPADGTGHARVLRGP